MAGDGSDHGARFPGQTYEVAVEASQARGVAFQRSHFDPRGLVNCLKQPSKLGKCGMRVVAFEAHIFQAKAMKAVVRNRAPVDRAQRGSFSSRRE